MRNTVDSTVTWAEVVDFISQAEPELKNQLLFKLDPARVASLVALKALIHDEVQINSIAVVSGSSSEPELMYFPGIPVTYFSFEDDSKWDLTQNWADGRAKDFGGTFDLVLCEQVLEHVANPQQALANLAFLLRKGGHLHLSTPALNGAHGEPYFYFAGFAPRMIQSWLVQSGFKEPVVGAWGSKKAARMYSTCDWTPLYWSGFPYSVKGLGFVSLRDLFKGYKHWSASGRKRLFAGNGERHSVIVWAWATLS